MNDYKIILRFLSYLKPYWDKETVLFFLMISGSVAGLASPYILKLILDNALPARDFDYLVNILLVLFTINIARIVITFVSDYLYELVSNYIIRDMRMDLFSHLIRLPKSFFDKNKEGDILHRINNEINTIQSIVTGSVFILDEATSGLDSDSEKMVFDKLVGIYQDKAMIFISHRLSTVKNVDEITCMHDGKIVERGSFEELIAQKRFYWKLFQNQIE